MKSLWAQMRSKVECNGISRDFVHLSQVMGYGSESVKYELAVILEKCIGNKDYKGTAIKNLVILAKDDERLKGDLEHFSCSKESSYKDIKPIAEEIIRKMDDEPRLDF